MKNSLWTGPRLSAGWIWPVGCRLPMHDIDSKGHPDKQHLNISVNAISPN